MACIFKSGDDFLNRGMIYLERTEPLSAQGDFEAAVRLGERSGQADYGLGTSFLFQKKYDQAVAALQRAEQRGFASDILYFSRANAYRGLGRADAALEDYGKALSKVTDPRARTEILRKRMETAISAGHYDTAVTDLRSLIGSSAGSEPMLRYNLGMALLGDHKYIEAVTEFDNLMTVNGFRSAALYGRSLAQNGLGRRDAALADIDSALKIEPGNVRFQRLRGDIVKGNVK